MGSVKKGTMRLLPAQKRSVAPIIERLQSSMPGSSQPEKENVPSKTETAGRTMTSITSRNPSAFSAKRSSARRNLPGSFEAVPKNSQKGSPKNVQISSGDETAHPLCTNALASSTTKEVRLSSRTSNWPVHPEEPTTTSQLNNLKKMWMPLLPSSTMSVLFPTGGIRKQEDAKLGCELLARAIQIDRNGSDTAIVDQLDLVFKWVSIGLCSRENTVGMQALLSLLLDLFGFLREQRYALSITEANILIPFVYEKTGAAMVRIPVLKFYILQRSLSFRKLIHSAECCWVT